MRWGGNWEEVRHSAKLHKKHSDRRDGR